jgi:hypothetical protein
LDTNHKECGEDSHSSLPILLQVQGTSNTTAHGQATAISSPTLEAISHYRRRLRWTHPTTIGHTPQQNDHKGLYCNICLFCDKGCPLEVVTSLATEAFLAALRRFVARRGKPRTIYPTIVPTSKVLPTNFTKSTKCFNPPHRWQGYRTSWPPKDVTGNSSHHVDRTSEDYGKQR